MYRLLSITVTGWLLGGCATPYQSFGIAGGLIEQRGAGKLEVATFAANGFTSSQVSQSYALYRSAELAQRRNKPFFLLYSSLSDAARGRPSNVARVGAALGQPISTAFMLALDGPQVGAHNTAEVLADLQHLVGPVSPSTAPSPARNAP